MSESTCIVPDCGRPVVIKSKGWCMRCYKRWWKLPKPRPAQAPPLRKKPQPTFCERCDEPIGNRSKSGLCHPCWLRRNNVEVEEIEAYGITFRRYPDSLSHSHRVYFKPGGYDAERGVEALHREVYKREIGPIPAGYDVHHIDHDPDNNTPDNLECMPRGDHQSYHGKQPRTAKQIQHWKKVQEAAKKWHRSPAGRAWHREHAIRIYRERKNRAS